MLQLMRMSNGEAELSGVELDAWMQEFEGAVDVDYCNEGAVERACGPPVARATGRRPAGGHELAAW